MQVVQQALEATGDSQQFAVALDAPAPGHAEFFERGVERDQVPVALGLGERAVDVPQYGAKAGPVHFATATTSALDSPVTVRVPNSSASAAAQASVARSRPCGSRASISGRMGVPWQRATAAMRADGRWSGS